MILRKYNSDDWKEVVQLFHDTVHSVNAVDYTDIQLDAWVPHDLNLPEFENRLSNNYSVVVEKDGIIVGFGNVNGTGYFDCLYIHKDYQRMGIATLIADDIEAYFYREGVHTITTDASITARPFFEKRGYVVLKEQSVECRGQLFINYKMRKTDVKSGWERENRTHFDEIVLNYDKYRWDYPAELFADAIQYAGSAKGKRAIEIGAGTGKATTPFLDAGYAVTAAEMSAKMTEFLRVKFMGYDKFDVITSTFEDAHLEDESCDIIYAASAFHWVDAEAGCPKVMRLLKCGGAFILFRNNVYRQEDSSLDAAIDAAYEQYYYSHYPRYDRPVAIGKMTYDDFLKPEEIHRGFRFNSLEQYGFTDITMKLYNGSRFYSANEYISLMDTMSDHRAMLEKDRAALYTGIKDAILNHGGQLEMKFIFQLYMGRKTQSYPTA
jgi:SAM-dependent methyltransferase/GNAT superfamily N-acetyltransferase